MRIIGDNLLFFYVNKYIKIVIIVVFVKVVNGI